jgi:glucose/arabinose dehydrogenase
MGKPGGKAMMKSFLRGLAGGALLFPGLAFGDSTVATSAGSMRIEQVASGLDEPWAVDFLPDGGFVVTERDGRLLLARDGGDLAPLTGVPPVFAQGQGGLLDVMIPADFAQSRRVWLSYAMPVGTGGATAAGFGRLAEDGSGLEDFQLVFMADPARGGRHFGARLVEAPDGSVFLTTGDRGTGPEGMQSQDGSSALGKVIRLTDAGADGWQTRLVSLDHRNAQGAALAADGTLYAVEHGAQGGDELNRIEPGRNYGWPVISYGVNYGGGRIGEGARKEGMEQPLHYWDPSIAPSGLMVYSGRLVPQWAGDFFFGSLNSDFLGRLDPDTPAPTGFAEERIAAPETGRVRDVAEAPDGSIWFLSVHDGAVYRLSPEG